MKTMLKINVALSLIIFLGGQACSTESLTYNPHSGNIPRALADGKGGEYNLHWHFPCASQEADHTEEYNFVGAGHNWLNLQTIQQLQFNISGRACNSDSARNTVFVLDTSGSMNSNDRTINGSCARYQTLKSLAAKLYRSESLNIGVVLFNGTAKCLINQSNNITFGNCQSANLIPAQTFKDITDNYGAQLKAAACANGGGTSYGQAFAAVEDILNKGGGGDSSDEVYFFSDGRPNSAGAAKSRSEKLKQRAFIATVGFGQTGPILKEHVASRVRGKPAHRQANKIEDLSTFFSELLDINHAVGKLEWERYGIDASKGAVEMNEFIQDDGSYTLPALNFDVAKPLDPDLPSGILLKLIIQPGFSKSSEYVIDADLRFE